MHCTCIARILHTHVAVILLVGSIACCTSGGLTYYSGLIVSVSQSPAVALRIPLGAAPVSGSLN